MHTYTRARILYTKYILFTQLYNVDQGFFSILSKNSAKKYCQIIHVIIVSQT